MSISSSVTHAGVTDHEIRNAREQHHAAERREDIHSCSSNEVSGRAIHPIALFT